MGTCVDSHDCTGHDMEKEILKMDWMDALIIGLLPLTALITVLQRKLLHGIIARGMFGLSASLVYAFLGAPDVAVTEALMGALLVTFLYVVVVKSTGVLRVGFMTLHPMIEEINGETEGLEADILKTFCREYHLKSEFHKFDDEKEMEEALKEGRIDVACGGLMADFGRKDFQTIPFLPTRELHLRSNNAKVDLLRARALIYSGKLNPEEIVPGKEAWYVFVISRDSSDLVALFREFMETHREALENLIKKHLGGAPE
ncbi:MAG TPA: hypothetical protein DHV12_00575 [Thermotogae bacterium]|nr:hypothetical protein [Thermotogota bacterium]